MSCGALSLVCGFKSFRVKSKDEAEQLSIKGLSLVSV